MDGYTKITLAGQEVGLKFGYPAIRWFSEEGAKNRDAFFMPGDTFDFSVEGFAKLVQCAYKNNCLIKEVEPVLKYQEFVEWTEEATPEEMTRVLNVYIESSVMKKIVAAQEKKSQVEETTETNQSTLTQ